MVRRILYATDFSRPSLAAFPHAIDAPKSRRAERVVLHVLPPPVTADAMSHVPERMSEAMTTAVVKDAGKRLGRPVARVVGTCSCPVLTIRR